MDKYSKIKNYFLGLAVCLALVTLCGCTKNNDAVQVDMSKIDNAVDDNVIDLRVRELLLASDDVKSLEIKVRTDKGAVQLSGFVDNQHQLDRCLSLAQSVKGVTSVVNQLSVKDSSTAADKKIGDGLVTATVKTAIMNDGKLKSFEINVVTHNGEVMLSGFVDSAAQATHAVDVAQGVEGVATVLNHMTVK